MATRLPDTLLIYNAGTWRTIFLGIIKTAPLVVLAWTAISLARSAWKNPEQDGWIAISIVLSAIVPLAFVAYYTKPFVISIHLRIPMHARESAASLAKFIDTMPNTTRINVSFMRMVPVPVTREARIGELRKIKPGLTSIANLRLSGTPTAALDGFKRRHTQADLLKGKTIKLFVGKNAVAKHRSALWDRILSNVPS